MLTFIKFNQKMLLILVLAIVTLNCLPKIPINENPYKTLGIRSNSTKQQVKLRFREMSKMYHPDKLKKENLSNQQKHQRQKKFQQIAEAYEFIKQHDFDNVSINRLFDPIQEELTIQEIFSKQEVRFDYFVLNIQMFFQEEEQRIHKRKPIQSKFEFFEELQSNKFYAFTFNFIEWSIKNKMVTLGATFISIGLFVLINSIKIKNQFQCKRPEQITQNNLNLGSHKQQVSLEDEKKYNEVDISTDIKRPNL